MSLLSFIFDLSTGGLPRPDFSLDEGDDDDLSEPSLEVEQGRCNNCGRAFHPVHINCFCPARCGGKVYTR